MKRSDIEAALWDQVNRDERLKTYVLSGIQQRGLEKNETPLLDFLDLEGLEGVLHDCVDEGLMEMSVRADGRMVYHLTPAGLKEAGR